MLNTVAGVVVQHTQPLLSWSFSPTGDNEERLIEIDNCHYVGAEKECAGCYEGRRLGDGLTLTSPVGLGSSAGTLLP